MVKIVLCVVAIVLPFACAAILWYCEPENSVHMRLTRRLEKINGEGWKYGFKWDGRGWRDSPIYKKKINRWQKWYDRVTDREIRKLLRIAARGVRHGILKIDLPQGCCLEDYLEIKHLI